VDCWYTYHIYIHTNSYIHANSDGFGAQDTSEEEHSMRLLMICLATSLAAVATAGGALAQNTLLLGPGTAPRTTTVPVTPNGAYNPGTSNQFFYPTQPQAYRMPNGRYQTITPTPPSQQPYMYRR
jgi:hypothetical protein